MSWDFYTRMQTIRRTEETLLDLYSRGLLVGTVHTCIGQEPGAVGVIAALDRSRDVVWSNHRGHGHYLAFTDDVDGLIAEVMGRATGVCGGIGGSQHLHKDNFYTNGVLGGTVACALGAALAEKARGQGGQGAALAEKARGDGGIACVFLGDGALGQGIVYESFNLAALWQLPLLFVLEHNGIAQTTPTGLALAGSPADRPRAFGIETVEMDGADVMAVHQAAADAVRCVRDQGRPFFLLLHSLRLMPHSKGDDTRSEAELAGLHRRDPLPLLQARLDATDPARRAEIDRGIEARVLAAVDKAEQAAYAGAAA